MRNKVDLIGNLGADPEVRYMPSGDAITTIRLATSRRWKNKQTGERQEETEWHRVVFFSGLAKTVGEYLKKGSKIHVEGRIRTQKWQGQDGQDRYTTEIIAESMLMLDGKKEGFGPPPSAYDGMQNQQADRPAGNQASAPPQAGNEPPASSYANANYDNFDDDIPFDNTPMRLAKHHLI